MEQPEDNSIPGLVIAAGTGEYPLLVAEGARAAGVKRIAVAAVRGQASRKLASLADEIHWFGVGEIRNGLEWCASRGIRDVLFAGQITPSALFRTTFDDLGRSILRSLATKNAHSIFGTVAKVFNDHGLRVIPASCYMDACLPDPGVLTRRAPDEREMSDIRRAHEVAISIGVHDIGQTLVIKDGMILAVEAFEGTNAAIRRGGKVGGRGAVVVKVARVGHDMRFDIPVVGDKTLSVLRKAGVSAMAFQARRTILLDRDKVVSMADRHGIALVSLDSGLPPAPTRP